MNAPSLVKTALEIEHLRLAAEALERVLADLATIVKSGITLGQNAALLNEKNLNILKTFHRSRIYFGDWKHDDQVSSLPIHCIPLD